MIYLYLIKVLLFILIHKFSQKNTSRPSLKEAILDCINMAPTSPLSINVSLNYIITKRSERNLNFLNK